MVPDNYHHGNLRQQLIETGISMINRVGAEGLSLRKVAAECGVSHAAPYAHFKDKQQLMEAMRAHVADSFADILLRAAKGNSDPAQKVHRLGNAYLDFFQQHPQYYSFIFHTSGISIDLDVDQQDDYQPFVIFRQAAYELLDAMGVPAQQQKPMLINMWSMVHGLASLCANPGIKYSGSWKELLHYQGFDGLDISHDQKEGL